MSPELATQLTIFEKNAQNSELMKASRTYYGNEIEPILKDIELLNCNIAKTLITLQNWIKIHQVNELYRPQTMIGQFNKFSKKISKITTEKNNELIYQIHSRDKTNNKEFKLTIVQLKRTLIQLDNQLNEYYQKLTTTEESKGIKRIFSLFRTNSSEYEYSQSIILLNTCELLIKNVQKLVEQ
jgi:hypothetical protein